MKKIAISILTICTIIGLSLISNTTSYAKPGDESDPVIVLSYLNLRLDEIVEKYNLSENSNQSLNINTEKLQNSIDNLDSKLKELSTTVSNMQSNNSPEDNNVDTIENSNTNNNTENISSKVNSNPTETSQTENNEEKLNNETLSNAYLKYKIVELNTGDKLIAEESSEIILRLGNCSAISPENGGLSDVTTGENLKNQDLINLNHLIIIPRSDGRGLLSNNNSILMIKGTYKIIKANSENNDLTSETTNNEPSDSTTNSNQNNSDDSE